MYFVGAGPGDLELLTVKADRIVREADVVIYTDSLVNPAIATLAKDGAEVHGSAGLSLEEICELMVTAAKAGKTVARVHTGDTSIFGAVLEQMAVLDGEGISYEVIPGVSSFVAAAAALGTELTIPDLVQTVIVTRVGGRTPMPPREQLADLASHQATMAFFLSVTLMKKLTEELMQGGYPPKTPAAVVYKASWPDQQIVLGCLSDIAAKVREAGIRSQSIVLVGKALDSAVKSEGHRSRLYDAEFTHSFRRGTAWHPSLPYGQLPPTPEKEVATRQGTVASPPSPAGGGQAPALQDPTAP